jgi:hypothetical protein
MRQIALKEQREIEDVRGRVDDPKRCAELCVELVVVTRGP